MNEVIAAYLKEVSADPRRVLLAETLELVEGLSIVRVGDVRDPQVVLKRRRS